MTEQATVPHKVSGVPLRGMVVTVVDGPDRGQRLEAKSDVLSIGTAPGNDLVLTDDTISRYHLELRRRRDRIEVMDLHSTNGTRSGSIWLEKATIPAGTKLELGRSTIEVSDGASLSIEVHDSDSLGGLKGRSAEMRALMAKIQRVARSDASILLLGETGVGKEVFARAVHEASPRADKAFETVDCGTLMPTLIASELFGHERGAFTGAEHQHIGAFERADGGTLFLDEIGELPPSLQPMLLGALERRSFRRVGGTKPITVDVRVVCATNRDLRQQVNEGTFRQDLYYRIGVVLLRIPPLRERTGDIPILAQHFLEQAGHFGDLSEIIPPNVMESLEAHQWPGNVRELRNFVEAALAMGEAPSVDSSEPLEAPGGDSPRDGFPSLPIERLKQMPYNDARAALLLDFEKHYLSHIMEKARGNVTAAARDANMNRSHLFDLLKRHSLK